MPVKKHHIKLDSEERKHLQSVASKRNASAFRVQRAKAILAMDISEDGPKMSDRDASHQSGLSVTALERLRKRVCEVGRLGALERKVRETPPVEPKFTGDIEAQIIRIACSTPPDGRPQWTLQMIADRLVELALVDSISKESVRLRLKKTTSSHGNKSAGASRRRMTPPS